MKYLIFVVICCIAPCLSGSSGESDSNSSDESNFDGIVEYIINGKNADIKKYPFTIGLLYNGQFTCGGSIVNENWVLTAAHCLFEPSGDQRSASGFTVVSGSSDIDKGTKTPVSSAVLHPNFRYQVSFTDDIALLQLSKPLSFDGKTKAALLPVSGKDISSSTPVTLLGWGFTSTGGNPAHNLKETSLQVFDQSSCASLYAPLGKTITVGEICAKGTGTGQCTGDSGGPLVTSGPKGLVLVGVVSFSQKPCANAQYPGVFTKVSRYIDFMRSYTG